MDEILSRVDEDTKARIHYLQVSMKTAARSCESTQTQRKNKIVSALFNNMVTSNSFRLTLTYTEVSWQNSKNLFKCTRETNHCATQCMATWSD